MFNLSLETAGLPPADELESLMQAASEVAQVAASVAVSFATRGFSVDVKSDGSPVTQADRAAERSARDWITARFSRDGIHGEEFGLERGEATRRWLIDPIDGTKSFVRHVPLWGTLIAVCERGRVLAGAAVLSMGADVICAAPGRGAWWNGARCGVSKVAKLDEALVLTTDESFRETPERRAGWQRVERAAVAVRSWGDCYGYFLVATGRAELMADPRLSEWDAACFIPIIREAGGVVTSWEGTTGEFSQDLVATNSGIAVEARQLLSRAEDIGHG